MKKQVKQGFLNLNNPFRESGGEKLLQFIWQFGYFNKSNLLTPEGESVTILSPGSLNKNQGPDFLNAKIKIGETTLAGTIELHVTTSEWRKHHHDNDFNYKNVILHVVYEHDENVNNVPVLELSGRISRLLIQQYAAFMNSNAFLPCSHNLSAVNELVLAGWKERLLVERLTRKSANVLELLDRSNKHWEETLWWLLARSFGGKVNGDAFQALASTIPINILSKHKSSIHQLEALLFGQANLLNEDFEDEYPRMLQREYKFLKKKYSLQSSSTPVLFLRMRPGNFPTIRLAQLAMLIHQASHLFSKIIEIDNLSEIKTLFAITANDFWHYHYTFNQTTAFKKKALGADTANSIIINTVIPILFAYFIYHMEEKYKEKALKWLEGIPGETNSLIAEFQKVGIKTTSAYDSQALIELKNSYCNAKKCLDCSIGNSLLKEAAQTYEVLKQA